MPRTAAYTPHNGEYEITIFRIFHLEIENDETAAAGKYEFMVESSGYT